MKHSWWHQVQGQLEDGTWELIDANLDYVSATEAVARYETSRFYGYRSACKYVEFRIVNESDVNAIAH